MRTILECNNIIKDTKLPFQINGSYWITDELSKNLISVELKENKWILNSNTEIKIKTNIKNDNNLSNINYVDKIILEENNCYYLENIMNKKLYRLFTVPSFENLDNYIVDFNKNDSLIIGNESNCDINLNNNLFVNKDLKIEVDKKVGKLLLTNLNNTIPVFVNFQRKNNCYLSNGDIIFKNGIFIYYFGCLILVSNNRKNIIFNSLKINKRLVKESPRQDYSNCIDKYMKVYDENQFFQRPPRFQRQIENKIFNIDAPTQKEKEEEMPLIFTIAPMITMGMMSLVTGINSLQKVIDKTSTIKQELTSLIMCGCMLITMIFFPLLQNFYMKIKRVQRERKRRRKYKKYIEKKRNEIFDEINYQKQVLIEENLSMEQISKNIIDRNRTLWERKNDNEDFLNLRLGIGTQKPQIEIKYPEEHFTMEEDDLKDIIDGLVKESKDIENVPITLNFKTNNKVGIIGNDSDIYSLMDNIMLQVMAYHGYDMLRIIILTNETNKIYWDKYINLPYLWNNEKSLRYYASTKEDINKITSHLMEELNYRKDISKDENNGLFNPYYLVISDDVLNTKNNIFISEILKNNNLGYSLILCVNKLDILPNDCNMFVNVTKDTSGLFTNHMTYDNQITFKNDTNNYLMNEVISSISNIPIDINDGKYVLPKKYGFLEMYDVGNVNQLNIQNRWINNDIINSLKCPVGIDEQGELFYVDLHEKAHGPHGLVAGMTGSGKSEWIITYILSMAVNYSPEEVQFVLIDYKGGGLALTFDNRENNIKLPHVVGTITNLDIVEIKRSLASIESELKRRQAMFKDAREILNESSMDIYKYQNYYRQGKLKEPMSHLFIISDEFAELKSQQPEFMDKLVSTARIGRSLGVHLILATQKPSGVVDDQIWSNSKFKVCLKVQDKSDSNDMIKCADAAMLKETGRFYFQVGYNELFMKGQSAYAGVPYYESDKKIKLVDSSIDFVDQIGTIIKQGDIKKNITQYVFKGEELPNILNYIIDTNKQLNLNIRQLWLTSIQKEIFVDKLIEKYNYKKEDYILNAVIGEYDNPNRQEQNLLTLPLTKEGNTIIYGSSGNGKENLVTTMLYSLITQHSIEEVNIYIIDFGSEVLNSFEPAPHIGDIIHSGDTEKIENLFKFINSEIKFRRQKFLNSNGNYIDYINGEEPKLPNIIFIINSYEAFSDQYDKYNDVIAEITRDSSKYGIYFILTSASITGIKSKITQNFKKIISLQLNDEMDYRNILGNTNNIVPSKFYGRGLIKIDRVVEFQTAFAFKKEKLYEDIKKVCIKRFMEEKRKARPIPTLPDIVSFNDINKNEININNIPVGIVKKTLTPAKFSLNDNISYLISCRNFDNIINFIDKLLYVLNSTSSFTTFVFDSKFMYETNKYNNTNYLNTNFNSFLNKISTYADKIDQVLKENNNNIKSIINVKEIVIVFIGIDKILKSFKDEEKKLFDNIISKSKDSMKIHLLFIDISNNLKKYEYESWYKETVDSSSGLWIGDGFAEQYSIKPTKIQQSYYEDIGNKYGYITKNGNVEFIKVIEKE